MVINVSTKSSTSPLQYGVALFSLVASLALLFVLMIQIPVFFAVRIWPLMGPVIEVNGLSFGFFDLVMLVMGLSLTAYASFHLVAISSQLSAVKDNITRETTELLTNGYYAKVRHPMSSYLMLLTTGVLYAAGSLVGVFFIVNVIVIQAMNAWYEEKYQLNQRFGKDYENYTSIVQTRFFPPKERLIMLCYLGWAILGLSFIFVGI